MIEPMVGPSRVLKRRRSGVKVPLRPPARAELGRNNRAQVKRSRDVSSEPMGPAVQAEDGRDSSRARGEGEAFHVSGIVVTRQGGNGR